MAALSPRPVAADLLARGATEHYADALYYDHTYRRRVADVAYYTRLARQHGGPVLELGGGSGRVALPIVREGHAVTVLDASAPMLARARARARTELDPAARRRLTLRRGDIRRFVLDAQFPLIIAPFNVLLHLYEPDEFRDCFRAVVSHLAPGGRFVFDVRVPDPAELARNPDRVYRSRPFVHPTLGHRVAYEEQFRYDPLKQVQFVTIRFRPGDGAPADATVHETLLAQRQIFPNELRALLALGGLRLAGRHGDFTGRPLAPDDPLEVVTAVPLGA